MEQWWCVTVMPTSVWLQQAAASGPNTDSLFALSAIQLVLEEICVLSVSLFYVFCLFSDRGLLALYSCAYSDITHLQVLYQKESSFTNSIICSNIISCCCLKVVLQLDCLLHNWFLWCSTVKTLASENELKVVKGRLVM